MLVLSRRVGEQIVIPSLDIAISVEDVRGPRAVVGVAAPSHMPIHRGECRPDPTADVSTGRDSLHPETQEHTVLLAIRPSLSRREYRTALEHQRFLVQTADDALQCLELLRDSLPDVLVIEPELPWGGGDGVLEVVYEELQLHHVPVFVLTAERNRSAMYRIARFASSDFAMQPLAAGKLVERVRRLVAVPRIVPS